MNKKLDILIRLIAALLPPLAGRAGVGLLLLLTSCSNDDILPADPGTEDAAGQPYVELRIAVPLADSYVTRANPMGGEEGNGREQGVLNEDKIHDINVFFYIEGKDASGNGLGMDSKDDTSIIKHIYYNLDNHSDSDNTPNIELTAENKTDANAHSNLEQGYVYLRFKCTKEELEHMKATGINFVAIANIGPLQDISTLGVLRNLEFSHDGTNTWSKKWDAFSNNASDMDYFLMSTAYNNIESEKYGSNKIKDFKSGDDYIGTTTLQRMYARLDLWYNKTDNAVTTGTGTDEKVTELKYQIVDKDKKSLNNYYVYLTNVLPVNVMQTPSYLFKKVTNFGEGWSDWSKAQIKFKEGDTASNWFSWGGKENPKDGPFDVSSTYNDRPTNYVVERHTTEKSSGGSKGDLSSWYGNTATEYVSGKSLYNAGTTNTDCSIKNTAIGGLSGYYHQTRERAGSDPDYGCNHISIISYANENTHPTDCFHSSYLTGLAFRAVYVPDKIYKSYGEITGSDGTTTTGLTQWTLTDEAPTKIYRYSRTQKTQQYESLSIYFTNLKAAQDYAKDHPEDMAIISTEENAYSAELHDGKWGFVCYYNLWLRHYNDESADPQETYPMEYATVRNNIYRVAVDFSGPGDPEPTMREPDTMKARIFVRKWNFRKETPIDF